MVNATDSRITVKTDAATKGAVESLAQEAGLSLDGLVNACLRPAIVSRHLEIYQPLAVDSQLAKILAEARQEVARGDFIGPFKNYQEAVTALDEVLEDGGPTKD